MKKLFSVLLVVCFTLSVCCLPVSATTQFSDITGNEWYAPAVAYCADNGYMSGTGNNKFDPNGKVSRAQMAQILYNFAGRPDMTNAENPFTDVKRDAWYGSAVLFAKTTGIVNGTSSTTYSPNNYITREQVAVMLFGYYKASTGNTPSVDKSILNSYTDKNMISSWAQDAIAWAIQNKIMSGVGNNKIDPKGTCTRAQLAQFIMNYCKAFGTPPPIKPDIPKPILPDIPGFPEDGNFEPISEDWLPKGGYTQGGRKYNMYGIDITDVDGVPDTNEIQTMALINNYRVENGLPELIWNRHAQVLAEIRAREMEYNLENLPSGTPASQYHTRPDGSPRTYQDYTTDNIGRQYLTTNNFWMLEEFNMTPSDIDKNMTDTNKVPDERGLKWAWIAENGGTKAYSHTNLASLQFAGWKNSPSHDGAMKYDFGNQTAYFAVAYKYKLNELYATSSYDAYGIDWVEDYLMDPDKDWVPGRGVDYNSLGFTINDIPYEYTDWIERDLDMTPEEYGPADHDINAINAWLKDQGLVEKSDTWYQVLAHYFSTLEMDDFVKFAISKTDWMHWTLINADTLASSEAWEIPTYKAEVVEMVADKLAYNHIMEVKNNLNKCEVCAKDHAEKRDLAAAEQVVNQFFQDTYGFDISAY